MKCRSLQGFAVGVGGDHTGEMAPDECRYMMRLSGRKKITSTYDK